MDKNLELCLNEGFELTHDSKILAFGREYPIIHPARIYLNTYKVSKVPIIRLQAMWKFHDYAWPHLIPTNNEWKNRMFEAHCEDNIPGKPNRVVVLASGGGSGKSDCCALIGIIFWLANQKERAVVFCSTTLDSLQKRIWGYVVSRLNEIQLPFSFSISKAKPPKIQLPDQDDELTGLFATAIREGEDERTLSTAVGKHPRDGLLVFLDEAPFMSPALVDAIPNWERGTPWFQLFALGNSDSTHDLHGGLAKPLHGWDSITVNTPKWPTCQERGVCLYFNPNTSPAITDPDENKREALSKFLPTAESLLNDKKKYGENSDVYYRQVLGFWKQSSMDEVVITEKRIEECNPFKLAHFSGLYPLQILAAIDPAIDDTVKGCVLRIGLLGHCVEGDIVLDFRSETFLHYISTSPTLDASPEEQLANNIIQVLLKFQCPLSNLIIDATGMGRLLAAYLKEKMKSLDNPIKIVYRRGIAPGREKDNDLITIGPLELLEKLALFIQSGQVRGLDRLAADQLCNRKIVKKNGRRDIESKDDYKKRMSASTPHLAASPNELDAAALLLQCAIIRYGLEIGQKREINKVEQFHNEKYRAYLIAQEKMHMEELEPRTKGFFSPVAKFTAEASAISGWMRNGKR